MEYVNFIVVFICSWWLSLFIMLPLGGNQPPEEIEVGHADSAPKSPKIKYKLLGATILAVILTSSYMFFVYMGYLRI